MLSFVYHISNFVNKNGSCISLQAMKNIYLQNNNNNNNMMITQNKFINAF